MSTHAIDAVSLSVMRDRLVGITDEIISALDRCCTRPIDSSSNGCMLLYEPVFRALNASGVSTQPE